MFQDPKYVARAQPDDRYCVWDRERNEIAISPDDRKCVDLDLEKALDLARDLNKLERSRPSKSAE